MQAFQAPRDEHGRPGLDSMLKEASRRKFDIVMAWAIDRLGRSLSDLLDTIQHLEACGVDLYLGQQAIDRTTPMGKLVFQVTGAFAEFERTMIRQRIKAGLKRAVAQGVKLGRPKIDSATERKVGRQLTIRCGYLEGRQIARHRHRHGAAHRKRASDEPARGGTMTSGPQLTNSLLRRAGPPGRGDFCFGDFTHATSPENLPKNGFCPIKGVAFL
jgi:DNA invertase Pin-like site-specific DNA recombinase